MLVTALILISALILFFLARKNPHIALTTVVALLPAYLVRFHLGPIPTNALEVLIIALIAAKLAPSPPMVHLVGVPWARIRQVWQTVNPKVKIAVTLFILAAAVSTGISSELRVSLGILKGWIVLPMLLGFLVYAAKISKTHLKKNDFPLIRGSEGVTAIFEVDYQQSIGHEILFALITSSTAVSLLALLRGPIMGRLVGIYDTPNSLALYVAPILTATIWLALNPPDKGGRGVAVPIKMILIIAAIIQAAALLGSQSVSGIAACIASLFICIHIFLRRQSWRRWYLGLSIGFIIAIIFFTASGKIAYLVEPLKNPSAHNSATVRLQLWSISLDLIKQHPLGGVGLGQFEPAYQQALHGRFQAYQLQATSYKLVPEFVFRDPHNWILSFWLNTGLLGLGSFVALNTIVYRNIKKNPSVVLTTCYLLLTTILLFGLTDTIYWKNDLAALYWVVVALLL